MKHAEKYIREDTMKKSKVCVTGIPEGVKTVEQKQIWKAKNWELSKTDKRHQITGSRSAKNTKGFKYKEKQTQAYYSETTKNQTPKRNIQKVARNKDRLFFKGVRMTDSWLLNRNCGNQKKMK